MFNLFDRNRPDPEAVRRIKALVIERFGLPDTTTLTVAELRCHEPDCPPVETVITSRAADGVIKDWRIVKPLSEVESADIDIVLSEP